MPTDPTIYAVPAFIVLMVVEGVYLARRRGRGRPYERRDTTANLLMGIGSLIILGTWGLAQWGIFSFFYDHRVADLGTGALAWVVALVGWDLGYYWDHRLSHETRLLWASHVNHHSSQRYNLSTALRQPWMAFQTTFFVGWLALLGVEPALIIVAGAINLMYQFWIHTEVVDRLGPLELVLNTPSHHRVHHAVNPQYLDKNYGGILIVWDRLFGSFAVEAETPVYGITKNIDTYNPFRIAFHEYAALGRDLRRARSLRTAVGHLLHGPGWQPADPEEPAAVGAAG
jgi:sterol desaturase/sphingolipid hydroxylase (fatty acid hydroxylase superfamily)